MQKKQEINNQKITVYTTILYCNNFPDKRFIEANLGLFSGGISQPLPECC